MGVGVTHNATQCDEGQGGRSLRMLRTPLYSACYHAVLLCFHCSLGLLTYQRPTAVLAKMADKKQIVYKSAYPNKTAQVVQLEASAF